MKERVQKLMAQANIGSRRACEEIISHGRVRVNGKIIKLGDQADPNADIIEVDGVKLAFPDRKLYIAFNKPRYVLSTDEPHEGDTRKMVKDFLPFDEHLFSAGRLDADSEGLMVLTNDGDLANRLTHPRYRHTKTYKVQVSGLPSSETIERWQRGVTLMDEDTGESFNTAPCIVKLLEGDKQISTLRIIMTEGKKRQIRRVASLLGHTVRSLIRTHIGKLPLGELRAGEWRQLDAKDIKTLTQNADEMPPGRLRVRREAAANKAPRRPEGEGALQDKPARKPSRPSARPGERDNSKSRQDRPARPGNTSNSRKPNTRRTGRNER